MELQGLKLLKATTNISKLADGLGISRMAIYKWTKVPAKWLIDVEKQTGIPREELRPDLYRGMKNE